MIEDSSRFDSNSAEVAASVLDGEVVLINLSTGVYYSMSNAGSVIWQLTDLGFSVSETVETVAARYNIPADRVKEDVRTLLEQLIQERIFVPGATTRARGVYEPDGGETPLTYDSPTLHVYRDMGDLLALDAPLPDMEDIPWKGTTGGE